jgi:hypothetical protein
MKKCYKFIPHCDDDIEEVDGLSEALEDIGAEGVWLDTGEITILLPPELAKCLEETGILGLT